MHEDTPPAFSNLSPKPLGLFTEFSKTVYFQSARHFSTSVIGVYVPCVSFRTPNNLLGLWIFLNVYGIFLVLFSYFLANLCQTMEICAVDNFLNLPPSSCNSPHYVKHTQTFEQKNWSLVTSIALSICSLNSGDAINCEIMSSYQILFHFISYLCFVAFTQICSSVKLAVQFNWHAVWVYCLFLLKIVFVVVRFLLCLCWNKFCG